MLVKKLKTFAAYLFSTRGVASRRELWTIYGLTGVVLFYIIHQFDKGNNDSITVVWLFRLMPILVYVLIIFCIRRLHDLNLNGFHIFHPISVFRMWFQEGKNVS